MKTVAEQIGSTPHLSPLLRRLRRSGLKTPDDLRRLAVARGCWHYRQPGDELVVPAAAKIVQVSDLELAMGMLTAAQDFDPVLVRCAAQLLSGPGISAEALSRLALQERAVPVVRHIARAGVEEDAENRERWQHVLRLLDGGRESPEGRLPHRSRFMLEMGVTRQKEGLDRNRKRVWLRPLPSMRS